VLDLWHAANEIPAQSFRGFLASAKRIFAAAPEQLPRHTVREVLWECVRGQAIMETSRVAAEMVWAPGDFAAKFDREPFGLSHNLSSLDLFAFDNLIALAEKYARFDQEYFVAGSAPTPGTEFYAVPTLYQSPHEALQHLDTAAYRVLLKRPENFDPAFAALLRHLFAQVAASSPTLAGEQIVRLESAIFISSAVATTPFHFDPEVNFFCQIEGDKTYHVYPPAAVTEDELERFYKRGIVNIGQVDLSKRQASQECVFSLRAGAGLHQPQNAPHWVETGKSRSISYSFVFETAASRAKGRARSANHYLRKFGLNPSPPGVNSTVDAIKSSAMQFVIPARQTVARSVRSMLGR